MMKKNQSNRYYCHSKTKTGKLSSRERTILLKRYQADTIDKYAARLRDIYGYNIQLVL